MKVGHVCANTLYTLRSINTQWYLQKGKKIYTVYFETRSIIDNATVLYECSFLCMKPIRFKR